jgi:hypothetical protein
MRPVCLYVDEQNPNKRGQHYRRQKVSGWRA